MPLPGQARVDLDIIIDLANRLGCGWTYPSVGDVFTEMAGTMPSLKNISWERLQREGAVTYPVDAEDKPGNEILFNTGYPTQSGRGKIVPAHIRPPDELPDEQYPYVLSTGRVLEHWHTGAMTRRAGVLNAIEPQGIAAMNPYEIERQHLGVGDIVQVETRRGSVEAILRADREVADGMVFMPFCFNESPANRLTNPMLDPYGKIPEFKYCAARIMSAVKAVEAAE